ncbi:MAG: hypothetical protein JSV65_09275 [Armatimonadota bacterium]|nr:MAG: hypothetical protein JSV65_09275 [Armatimonadota bacterium]
MRGSKWIVLAVIVAIVAVLTTKQAIKLRAAKARAATAAAPASPDAGVQPAPDESAPPGDDQHATVSSSLPDAQGASASAQTDAENRGASEQPTAASNSRRAEPPPAPDGKPEGPLPGSKLAECLKSGRPTLADFGKGWCKPCKLMAPLLKRAAQDYWGKANIVFVDLDDYPELWREYRIAMMSTQVFFDAQGREVARHMSYMSGAEMDRQLAALGVEK